MTKKEINIYKILKLIWNGKLKIFSFVVSFFIITFSYIYLKEGPQNFVATTKINLLSAEDMDKYNKIEINNVFRYRNNYMNFIENRLLGLSPYMFQKNLLFNVSEKDFVKSFFRELQDRKIFREGIIKFELINRKDFEDEMSFNQAVISMSNSIKLKKPFIIPQTKNPYYFNVSMIHINYYDKEKLFKFLKYIYTKANERVRKEYVEKFNKLLISIEKNRIFKINNIRKKIDVLKKVYLDKISKRILFLKDQTQIARTLNLKGDVNTNNNLAKNFNNKSNSLYHLRGYVSMEKEIEILYKRMENKLFISDEILKLQIILDEYIKDNQIKKAKSLFNKTPFNNSVNFKSVKFFPHNTKFEYKDLKLLLLTLSVIFGGVIGTLYVLLINRFKKD